jgi:hypothetical protein
MGGPKHRGQVVVGNTEKGKFKPAESKINFAVPRRAVVSSAFDKNLHTSMKRRKAILFNGNSPLANIWLKDIQFSSTPIFLIS